MADVDIVVKASDQASVTLKGIGTAAGDMSKQFKVAGLAMMGVGTALVGGLFALTKGYADAGDEVAKMAQKTGFSTEMLSKLRYAAELSGTSLQGIEVAFRKMAVTISEAKSGTGASTEALKKLGISLADLQRLKPEDQFMQIAFAMANVKDPMERAAMAQEMFGRSGLDLLPMLSQGEAGMRQMMERARELGLVFDAEAAAASEKFNDALTTLKGSLMGLGGALAEVVMPKFTAFIENMTEMIIKVKDWASANPALADSLLKLGVILIGAGGLLFAFSQISKAIIAINIALAIMHGLAGPVGWLKLAAGLAIAGGAIYGMTKLMEGATTTAIPAMQYGGIVTRPTTALIGEAGPEMVMPLNKGRVLGNTYNIVTIQAGSYLGSEADARRMVESILIPKLNEWSARTA